MTSGVTTVKASYTGSDNVIKEIKAFEQKNAEELNSLGVKRRISQGTVEAGDQDQEGVDEQ